MSGAAMRGAAALPGSETSSRTKGSRRNLGDLLLPAAAQAVSGRGGKLSRAKPPRKAGGVGRLSSTNEALNKADHVGGGGCGGKAAGGVVQIRVTPKTRNPFTIKALSISGVTWNRHVLNHALFQPGSLPRAQRNRAHVLSPQGSSSHPPHSLAMLKLQ